jgi:cytochrome P450
MKKIPAISFYKALGFVRNANRFIDEHPELGSFYQLNLVSTPLYVVADPDILHHVLVANESNYLKSKIYWGQLKAIIGNALGTMEGEEWLWMKRLQQPFFTHEKANAYLPEVLRMNELYFDRWADQFTKKEGKDLIAAFSEMNLAAILKVIFGIDQTENAAALAQCIGDGEASIAYRSKFPWRPYTAWLTGHNKRAAAHLNFFDGFAQRQVALKYNNTNTTGDMLDELILHSEFNNGKLSLKDIRNELIVHLGASTETAAVATGWTLYLESYPVLIKTKRAVQEAMRLYPPSHAILRDAQEADTIQGVAISKGATLYISAYALHRNPAIWEQPDVFMPERFEGEKDFPKYSYIPFGAGRHTCIGRYLGLPQVVLSIAAFLQRFDYELITRGKVGVQSLSTLKPDQAFRFRLKYNKTFTTPQTTH